MINVSESAWYCIATFFEMFANKSTSFAAGERLKRIKYCFFETMKMLLLISL